MGAEAFDTEAFLAEDRAVDQRVRSGGLHRFRRASETRPLRCGSCGKAESDHEWRCALCLSPLPTKEGLPSDACGKCARIYAVLIGPGAPRLDVPATEEDA